jgi:uridine phosphorylase
LLLAQELLREPKMSNHARGLWGYSGESLEGGPLSIQATGMGGPSAAVVLADLAELGVRRAIRVGTCAALDPTLTAGQLLAIEQAHAWGGPGGSAGEAILPDDRLSRQLQSQLGNAALTATVASLDVLHQGGAAPPVAAGEAADMQTAALFAAARSLGVAIAAALIVVESAQGERLDGDSEERAAKLAGGAASRVLSTSN